MLKKPTALLIGINNYPDAPLTACVNDANEMAACLQLPEYDFEVNLLLDQDATRARTLRAIAQLLSADAPIQLLYFSGHGVATDGGTFLLTAEGDPFEGIDLEHLRRLISNRPQRNNTSTIIILDCCHAGAALPWELMFATSSDLKQIIHGIGASRVVLAACQSDEKTRATPGKNGEFTSHLLQGMLGAAADNEGRITVPSLWDYVSKRYEGRPNETPVMRGDITGAFVLASGFTPISGSTLPETQASRIEEEGKQLLEAYIFRHQGTLDTWGEIGYQEARTRLQETYRWFHQKRNAHSILLRRPKFSALYEMLMSHVGQLGTLFPGAHLLEGVAVERVGLGGFGAVWKIQTNKPNLPWLAFKVYHPNELGIKEKLERFHRGYRAMQRLDHSQIVKVHNYTEVPVGFFMDFIDGSNLRGFQGTVSEPADIAKIVLRIAETLGYAHAKGVRHRDVKPENIILGFRPDGEWIPHLTDFDLAWFSTATTITRDAHALGSTAYSAPEQLLSPQSDAAHAPPVDIFSFGQLLYFCTTGSDPAIMNYEGNVEIFRSRLHAWASSSAAREWLRLYIDLTHPKPSNRIQTFDEVVERLSQIHGDLRGIRERILSPSDFVEELIHGFAGVPQDTGTLRSSFQSASGRTVLSFRIERSSRDAPPMLDIDITIAPSGGQLMAGGSNEEGRRILNARVRDAIRGMPGVSFRPGHQGAFQGFVSFTDLPCSNVGLTSCSRVIRALINAVERL